MASLLPSNLPSSRALDNVTTCSSLINVTSLSGFQTVGSSYKISWMVVFRSFSHHVVTPSSSLEACEGKRKVDHPNFVLTSLEEVSIKGVISNSKIEDEPFRVP